MPELTSIFANLALSQFLPALLILLIGIVAIRFAAKLVETLVDYGMEGVHLADSFCPTSQIYMSDYSLDLADQFMQHTGIAIPAEYLQSEN